MKDPTFLNDDEVIAHKIPKAAFAMAAMLEASLKKHSKVTFQRFRVLRFLQHHPEASQIILAHVLSVSPPAVTRHITKLEREGYVRVERAESDARKSKIILTARARAELREAEPHVQEVMKNVIGSLDKREREILDRALDKVMESACDIMKSVCNM